MLDTSNGPLTPAAFYVLLVLVEGRSHGYAIMAEVERMTSGEVRLGPGTLYRTVQRLLLDGLIDETATGDPRRIVYAITSAGRAAARVEANRLALLVRAAKERGLVDAPRIRRSEERKR